MSLLVDLQTKTKEARLAVMKASTDTEKATLKIIAVAMSTLTAAAVAWGKDNGNREPTDQEVVKKIQAALDGAIALRAQYASRGDDARVFEQDTEIALYQRLMPKKADIATVQAAIDKLVAALQDPSAKHIGGVLAALRAEFGTALDDSAGVLVKTAVTKAAEAAKAAKAPQ